LSDETIAKYSRVKNAMGLSGSGSDEQCLARLLDHFEGQGTIELSVNNIVGLLDLSASEMDEVAQAVNVDHVDFWQMLHNGLLREVRIQNTQAAKLKTMDLADIPIGKDGRSGNRIRGSAQLRIQTCVAELMRQNLEAKHALDLLYITRGIVQDLTKSHSDFVSQWFSEHEAELEAHHQSLGITSHTAGIAHNRLRARWLREQEKTPGSTTEETMAGKMDEDR